MLSTMRRRDNRRGRIQLPNIKARNLLIMQRFSGKIKGETESIGRAFPFLSNSTIGVSKMTTNNLPPNTISIKICAVDGCNREGKRRHLCHLHYDRLWRSGTTDLLPRKKVIKICSVDDCDEPSRTKKLCAMHYMRLYKHGDHLIVTCNVGQGKTFQEKFWSKVKLTADVNRCWEWTGARNRGGYGAMGYNKRTYQSHRFAWFLIFGKFPDLDLLHSCDNPPCVNPNHLREGTDQDNSNDKVLRNRQLKGSKSPVAKLNESQVLEIKQLLKEGHSHASIGRMYGVRFQTIGAIKYGKIWKHVKSEDL